MSQYSNMFATTVCNFLNRKDYKNKQKVSTCKQTERNQYFQKQILLFCNLKLVQRVKNLHDEGENVYLQYRTVIVKERIDSIDGYKSVLRALSNI